MAIDPIGALTTLLPTWFLVPFALVAVLGLVGGAVLDIYSSGLALLSVGLPVPRFVAAAIDGVLMIAGSIYLVFIADTFIGPFQGFLITLGVLIAAWCGIFLGDFALRRQLYASSSCWTLMAVRRRPYRIPGVDGDRCLGRLGPGHEFLRGLARVAGIPLGHSGWAAEGSWAYANLGVRGVGDRVRRHAPAGAADRTSPEARRSRPPTWRSSSE